ncbi:MAG: hypothetical protein ACYSUD_11045 [Planctomycetota bacterium]|jgi:hypothetical protein
MDSSTYLLDTRHFRGSKSRDPDDLLQFVTTAAASTRNNNTDEASR